MMKTCATFFAIRERDHRSRQGSGKLLGRSGCAHREVRRAWKLEVDRARGVVVRFYSPGPSHDSSARWYASDDRIGEWTWLEVFVGRTKIDFDGSGSDPRESEVSYMDILGRHREAGTDPSLARRRQIAYRDNYAFDAMNLHRDWPFTGC